MIAPRRLLIKYLKQIMSIMKRLIQFYYYQQFMFNDIQSVRSLPISSSKKVYKESAIHYECYSPSEKSRLRSPQRIQHWKNSLHPQIDQKYNKIMNGQTVKWDVPHNKVIQKGQGFDSTSKSQKSIVQRIKYQYEEKIRGLQLQNHSLREELYYLREALLINFQTKNSKKENE